MIDDTGPVPRHHRNPRRAYEADGREITPADIRNIRENGATALTATCACGHEAEVPLDRFSPETFVPDAGLRLRCSACGRRGVATVPVWRKMFVPGT